MTTSIKTWQIIDGTLKPVTSSLAEEGRTEAYDLEEWIASDPSILGPDLLVIGRQVPTKSGPLDLLAIDKGGNLVIIELKRDKLPRDVLAQAIDYASDVATWTVDRISEVCTKQTDKSLADAFNEQFPDIDLEAITVNDGQRILLVGFAIETSLERMVQWLSDSYGVSVNAIILNYIKTASGDELLTKTAIISEEVEQERIKQRKFKIPMSDEPGDYETDVLKNLLAHYLSQDLFSARRIRDVLFPALLEHPRLTRGELKDEFVERAESEDPTQAGYFLSLISGQVGMEKNDFLRQVIDYDYPNYPWEKDNYRIRDGCEDVVREVLDRLRGED